MRKTTSDKQIDKQLKVYQTQVVVQHVQDNARYYAQLDQPYSVGWGGKSLFANSPRDLVNQILKIEKQ
jgi:hypothetical protein